MLGDITAADEIYIVTGRTDMRKSIDGLCAIVEDQLHMDPRRPRNQLEVKQLTWQQFDWLMSGLEIEQPKAFKPTE